MKYIFHCETQDGKPAHVVTTDVDAFVKAEPDAAVFASDMDGNQFTVKKGDLTVLFVSHD